MLNSLLAAALTLTISGTQEIVVLTNADILAMVRAKLPSVVIIEKIHTSSSSFDTLPPSLAEMKNAGVPDEVLIAMVRAPNRTEPCGTATVLTIPNGTPLEVESNFTVTSGNVEEGGALSFNVVHPVKVNDITVIAAGARATARITKAKRGSTWGRAGQLAWSMEYVDAVDGSRVPLEFSKSQKGFSKGATVATAVAVTGVLFWPAAPFWGFKRGKDAKLLAGSRFEVKVRGNTPAKVTDNSCPR